MDRKNNWTVRALSAKDSFSVIALLSAAKWNHRHLGWLDAHSLMNIAPFLMAYEQGLTFACLGCPPEPQHTAWLRLFSVLDGYPLDRVWNLLWPAALAQVSAANIKHIAAIPLEPWLLPLLTNSGFRETNAVIFLEHQDQPLPSPPRASGTLRRIRINDLSVISRIDRRAFRPIWRHSEPALLAALRQALFATLIEIEGRPVGYQISTASGFGGHLARLAVDPDYQHQGIATALVVDVLRRFSQQSILRVTVNTHEDNLPSQRLYRRLGFHMTQKRFPVLELMPSERP